MVMTSPVSFFRALSPVILFISLAAAQQCFYPDGSPSADAPCSLGNASSCCSTDSFCLANGLCFGDGVISRGSCTDESWESEACTPYCRTAMPNTSIPLSPCSVSAGSNPNVFVCGLETTCTSDNAFAMQAGSSFVLRPAQVAAIAGPALASAHAACRAASANLYPLAAIIGVGAGLGLPLIGTIIASIIIFRKQARRRVPTTLLYDLPDGYKSDVVLSSPSLRRNVSRPGTGNTVSYTSGNGASHPLSSIQHSPSFSASHYSDNLCSPMSGLQSPPPMNINGYMEHYGAFKDTGGSGMVSRQVSGVQLRDPPFRAAELDSTEKEIGRAELAARTKSTKSVKSGKSSRKPRHELGDYR